MLLGTMLVRNESGRWLETVLEQMKSVCDKIFILDDHSTDNTPEICRRYTKNVSRMATSYWSTDEVSVRKLLWQIVTHNAKDGDWILCLDADETIKDIKLLPEMIKKAEEHCIADKGTTLGLGFNLYDMWSPTHYREDIYWNAHFSDWVMCVRCDHTKKYVWREQGLHCGRFPVNAYEKIGQTGMAIQHWGWSRPADREEKYKRYITADPEGKFGILEQYQSILDPNPNLKEFGL